ncbi:hypothetical protein CLOM_g16706 [Closterium sp. NIES-68]|nr:hypothetical protein CLOM_g16706 [Closterium sp. NIES-68]GJP82829.1 hypothetical protein CLOP_g13056 [Closterium sp. NIES-67]
MMHGKLAAPGVVKLDQVPRWTEQDFASASLGGTALDDMALAADLMGLDAPGLAPPGYAALEGAAGAAGAPSYAAAIAATSDAGDEEAGGFDDPLTERGMELRGRGRGSGGSAKFPVSAELNAKIYVWRGWPWALEVDAVVNSTSEALDPAFSTPGLHDDAGPGLAEECAALGGCRTGEAKMTGAYELPARRVIHTVGPRYTDKYQTAAENALSRCYRICLELLLENELRSIALAPIYSEAKGYPREPAAHVAIRTVRRFLEKHGRGMTAVVLCIQSDDDHDIYKRLLPLYFPRDAAEEAAAQGLLPADVGDENGEIVIAERMIRISKMPGQTNGTPAASTSSAVIPAQSSGLLSLSSPLDDSLLDPAFISMAKDPDQRRVEQREHAVASAQTGWIWLWARCLGLDLGDTVVSLLTAGEQLALHGRYLARAEKLDLSEVQDMRIMYRGGTDSAGRSVMVVVGAHFLVRCLDLESFIFHAVKEFEPIINRPFTIVYFHAATALPAVADFGWMKRLLNVLGPKFRTNLHTVYAVHPDVRLKGTVWGMQLLVDPLVFKKVKYVGRLLELFRHVSREQITIPEFVFMHDVEVNPQDVVTMSFQTRFVSPQARLPAPA